MKPIRRLFIDTGMRQSIELFLKEVSFCAMRASCCSYGEVRIYIPQFLFTPSASAGILETYYGRKIIIELQLEDMLAKILITVGTFTDFTNPVHTTDRFKINSHKDSALKGPVWDTKKITAHHAIIPTGEEPRSLTAQEKELYLMIAVQYFLQFYPPMLYEAQKVLATIVKTAWEARGRMIIEPGWTGFAAEEDDEDAKKKEAEQSLPSVGNNDAVLCADVDALKKKTTPPSRFSEGSLIEAMANVHRFVSDAKAKAVLKENEGIGTEATRASILETLKSRGFIAASGKSLVSTPLGQSLIDMTPDTLRDPVTTAQWEQRLEAITRGENSLEDFMREQYTALPLLLAPVLSTPAALQPGAFPCPKCGKALRRREGKNAGEFFWSCSDADCRTFLPDEGGKPGQPKEKSPRVVTEFICPDCGKALLYRQGTSKAGKPYEMFSCSGYPQCKSSFWANDGKPDFSRRPK